MQNQQMLRTPTYDPNNLFDTILELFGYRNDAELSLRLGVAPPVISKIRHKHMPLGDVMLIRLHEETGMTIREIRALAGIEQGKIEYKRAALRLGDFMLAA